MEFQIPPGSCFTKIAPLPKTRFLPCSVDLSGVIYTPKKQVELDFFGKKIRLGLTNEGMNHHQDHVKLHSLMNPAKGQPEYSVVLCGFKSKWSKQMKKCQFGNEFILDN